MSAAGQGTAWRDPTCDPRDVLSVEASLLGLSAKQLAFTDAGPYDAAGSPLIGMGHQSVAIQYDLSGSAPDERFGDGEADSLPMSRNRDGSAVTAPWRAATDRGSASEKGSLVIYPNVELRWNAAGDSLIQDTFIDLTNDYPDDVSLQMYLINGDAPLGL